MTRIWRCSTARLDGDEADQRGEWAEAARFYRSVLMLEENSAEARVKLAAMLRRGGDYESAFREYERLIRDGTGTAPVHFGMAICLERLGKLNEAVESAEKAIALNGSLADAYRLASAVLGRPSKTEARTGRQCSKKNILTSSGTWRWRSLEFTNISLHFWIWKFWMLLRG